MNEADTCKLIINEDKVIPAVAGDTLLHTLFREHYSIPSACGGRGMCGYCKLKVTRGGPLMPKELKTLSDEERTAGFRLSCQVKLRDEVHVTIPPEYIEFKEYEAEVESVEMPTPEIRGLTLRLVEPERISFKAGQYVQVQAPDPSTGDIVYRAYSIASPPWVEDRISLNVRLEKDGAVSPYLHGLGVGDRVVLSGPYGELVYTPTGRDAVCLATGVGLAPFRSLIPVILAKDTDIEVYLYFGARVEGDLYGEADIEEWRKSEKFHYVPILSNEDARDWGGEWGRMDIVFFGKFFTGHKEDEYYICGAPFVVNSFTAQLIEKGVPESRIHFDKFG